VPPSEPAVRIARANDTQAILELLVACRLPVDGVPDDAALLLVAEQDGRVAGSAGLELMARMDCSAPSRCRPGSAAGASTAQ
jgi:N-acetylglutamate synthase-like GNAT family acetyltransferase